MIPDGVDIYSCLTGSCEGLRYMDDVTKQFEANRKQNAFHIVCDIAWQLKLLLQRDGILEEILQNKKG